MTKSEGLKLVEQKVEDFSKNEKIYLSKDFQETEARNRFIDSFFTALGWELEQTGLNRQFWDVIREFSQKDDSSTKKPDYAFRVKQNDSGRYTEKFFVEAKAPWVPLTEAKPVFQAKSYSFSSRGKTPIVILTDFQEFRVFNGLERPRFDNPLQGLIKGYDFKYSNYLDKWDLLWDTFSKEAVYDGSIEQLAGKVSKTTKTLDQEFLSDLTEWRELLAKNIAVRNKNLTVDEINEAVQRILDRLVFIRNLEDRNIEEENLLFNLINRDAEDAHLYKSIVPVFHKLDGDYNGILFKKHFSEEIDVDNKTIKDIIKNMCYPNSPFRFDRIEPEILGRIYEQFLGSKIRLTDEHRAKVEEKPEVRHAGGVYYTPEYIVKYIVENTVGEKIKGKTPEEIESIKILDPACGSGSFLLGAFDYLIEYHKKYYAEIKSIRKYKDDYFITPDETIRLTIKKKSEILKNNIFGVDIDLQATEVAIMSLYLKLLDEGFDKGQMLLYMKGHILPDMSFNIKCGNSLISSDFYNGQLTFSTEDKNTINAFDYEVEFNNIFKTGGFDCVVGNPPWVFTKYVDWGEATKSYIDRTYLNTDESISNGKARQSGKINLYSIFLLKGIGILKKDGLFSFIIPNTILRTTTYDIIRKFILSSTKIIRIVDLKSGVFEGVTASTIIIILQNSDPGDKNTIEIVDQPINESIIVKPSIKALQNNYLNNASYAFNIFVEEYEGIILNKLTDKSVSLGDIVDVYNGIATGPNKKGLHNSCINKKCKKLLLGRDIKSYFHKWNNNWIEYDHNLLHRSRNEDIFLSKEKLIMQRIGGILITSYDNKQYYTFNSVNNLLVKNNNYPIKYILALLNSKALRYFYIKNYSNKSNLTVNISKTYLDKLPIPVIDLNNQKNKQIIISIIAHVDEMINVQEENNASKSDDKIDKSEREIKRLNKIINSLVYQLYNLTDEEINIIESV